MRPQRRRRPHSRYSCSVVVSVLCYYYYYYGDCVALTILGRCASIPTAAAFAPAVGPVTVPLQQHQQRHQRQSSRSSRSGSSGSSSSSSTAIMGIKGFRSWFESQFPNAMEGLTKEGAQEDFDHVLIDMNQLLHVVLRKSRSEGHCFALLMQELDVCVAMATPKQSLILAMDGPPGAAKLATQRRRRFHTVHKTAAKVQQINKLLLPQLPLQSPPQSSNHSGATQATEKEAGVKKKRSTKRGSTSSTRARKQWIRQKRKAVAETRTLCITPATAFMATAEQAILYWAWQRLSVRSTALSSNSVKIFISPSTVPGEGEVKLLEWIYTKQRRGESVAILGGDSDLVLEALVIPLASTHNVFVLLPDGNKRYLSVSLWETTRTLGRYLPHLTTETVIKVRTDLVLLLILNGNDYLPKLRGSSGFNKLFHSYLRLQRDWNAAGRADSAYLVDPDTLQYNLKFATAFFGRLAAMAPANLWSQNNKAGKVAATDRNSPMQQLNNLVDGGFLPKPMKFMIIWDDDEDDRVDVNTNDNDDDEDDESIIFDESADELDGDGEEVEETDGDQILVRLLLGEPGTEDFYTYEIWHPRGVAMKMARQKLAVMALADLMDDRDVEDEDDDDDDGLGITSKGYDWEIHHTVKGKVEPYLYGLLWNLQTYQDGVCADYSYNYGKRLSPLAKEITQFFELALKENRTVGLEDLQAAPFSPPVSAGLSCLAALPSPVKHLVPEPYRWLEDETVEDFYASCMDPEDNVFDIKKFERLCEEEIRSILPHRDIGESSEEQKKKWSEPHDGRRIIMGDHYWTVISKVPKPLTSPFDPPKPFSDRLAKLKANNMIRVSRFMATAEPRPRSVWNAEISPSVETKKDGFVNKEARSFSHSDPGPFLAKVRTIGQVDYRVAYQKNKKKEFKGIRNGKVKLNLQVQNEQMLVVNGDREVVNGADKEAKTLAAILAASKIDKKKHVPVVVDISSRMKHYNIQPPPTEVTKNLDGETAMALLNQLSYIEFIGPLQVSRLSDHCYLNCRSLPNVLIIVPLLLHSGTRLLRQRQNTPHLIHGTTNSFASLFRKD